MKKTIYSILVLATLGSVFNSCSEDFTETRFFQSEQAKPITSVEQLQSFMNGTYVAMRSSYYLGSFYRAYGEVRSDEMYHRGNRPSLQNFTYFESTYSSSTEAEKTWEAAYGVIANANIIINSSDNLTWGESSNPNVVSAQIKNIKGQAYATRAWATFDLLRLYGQKYSGGTLGVVLPTTFNPKGKQARATIAETEARIEADFQAALNNIGSETDNADKTYISPLAIKALMTRYYLYKENYAKVAELVKEIYDSDIYKVIPSSDLVSSFSKPNTENSIFELAVGKNGALSVNSYDYLLNGEGGYQQIAVLSGAINLYAAGDIRLSLIKEARTASGQKIGDFLSNKFSSRDGSNNIKLIRYEEVLLSGAEASIKTGDLATALKYYNKIRENRNLATASSVTLDDIKQERSRELIGEGFRYWDLLRWGATLRVYDDSGAVTNNSYNIGNQLIAMPIPQSETNVSGSLVQPNPGYDNSN
ncbi:RagB/SusD family nutrient uptake outer membrane protein [Bergeyella cardium]|uniref:RagB/SusD family nutrient uptake outer membrane protein n=1 Tax=Bergeyella cardium TaxID=1585976 RepID=UPI000EA30421|nr:RagB/SusD family nutrient uptake outer membrane protein [Bergeyella cardium]